MTRAERQKKVTQEQIIEVTKKLQSYGVTLDQWGTGPAKTVTQLAKEVFEGETVLIEQKGKIFRTVELVHIDVRFKAGETELQLFEDRQEFRDGRQRRRGFLGISEKVIPGEDPLSSAKRALMEELGISSHVHLNSTGVEKYTLPSPSYPGLMTKYKEYKMQTYIPDSAYKADGYVEEQTDKNTYFVWQKIEPN